MQEQVDYPYMNQLLFEGKDKELKALTEEAIHVHKKDPKTVLNKGLIAGMNVVGEDFKRNRVYLPEVVIAARAMKHALTVIDPFLTTSSGESQLGTLVMGTVKGDLHDIGKNLVLMMAEGAGFTCVNLGVNVSVEKFVEAVKTHNPQILGMSALLTTTMTYMKVVIDTLKSEGYDDLKFCVGGAPVNQMFADEVGADGYAPDAASAVELFKSLANKEATCQKSLS